MARRLCHVASKVLNFNANICLFVSIQTCIAVRYDATHLSMQTINIVAVEVSKTSCECDVAFALVNRLCYHNNKCTVDRLRCCTSVVTITEIDGLLTDE